MTSEIMPARPANHSLYYFKRPIDTSAKIAGLDKPAKLGMQKLEAEKLQQANDNADQDAD
jgi:hypothetical protein